MNSVASYPNDLRALLDAELRADVSPAAAALGDELGARFGDAVLGILYYGACFRSGEEEDGILDLFVIVDDYRSVYSKRLTAFANRLLPPNIFYYEMDFEGATVRTKYAIISLDQFAHRTSCQCFHTFFWARFAQPCALILGHDHTVRQKIVSALENAVITFTTRVLPLLPSHFDAETLWTVGLSASYRTELRPERGGTAARLVAKNLARYQAVTRLALARRFEIETADGGSDRTRYVATLSRRRRWFARQGWRIRRVQGKVINLLRIMKAAFTFDGGVDYILWKIERHSGIKVEATPMLRRHPLLACWPTVWRLYRAGAFR
ncbi:MAG: hypothetical protein QF609_01185 [Gammaproteobacteria bacterium]|jgi:hypothetical protein|nr:hypothetical protein [Gammaproteobacteria bacterium]